MSGNTGLAI